MSTKLSPEDRFWSSIVVVENCWHWTKKVSADNGYGHFKASGRTWLAHRWAYEHFRGIIPEGKQIDHLCRNRACVNPEHMEVVTALVNTGRGFSPSAITKRSGVCQRGHPMSGDNLGPGSYGRNMCRACYEANMARTRDKRLAYYKAWRLKQRSIA
jgi:hypothetical protein